MPSLIARRFDISVKYTTLSCCAEYIFLLSGLYFGGYKYIIIINLSTPVIKYIYICGLKSTHTIAKGGGPPFIIRFIMCSMHDDINPDVH